MVVHYLKTSIFAAQPGPYSNNESLLSQYASLAAPLRKGGTGEARVDTVGAGAAALLLGAPAVVRAAAVCG